MKKTCCFGSCIWSQVVPLARAVPVPWVPAEPWPVSVSLRLLRLELGKYQGKGKIQQDANKSSAP